MNVLGRETKPLRSNAHNTHFGYGTSVLQRALEAAGFSFNQHTTIRSNVHSVLMEKLWWTYPSTNRLVPFKDIVDADADADEEVSLEVSLEEFQSMGNSRGEVSVWVLEREPCVRAF